VCVCVRANRQSGVRLCPAGSLQLNHVTQIQTHTVGAPAAPSEALDHPQRPRRFSSSARSVRRPCTCLGLGNESGQGGRRGCEERSYSSMVDSTERPGPCRNLMTEAAWRVVTRDQAAHLSSAALTGSGQKKRHRREISSCGVNGPGPRASAPNGRASEFKLANTNNRL
jgi:hypothetical protein